VGYRLVDSDPPTHAVERLTFVAFLPGGACVAIPDEATGLRLITGDVRPGEHYLLDTCLRVPLETAGYRRQRVRPFAIDGTHVYAWLDGDRYGGHRPHATVELVVESAEAIAARLAASGQLASARAVRDGVNSFRNQTDEDYYANNLRLLEPAYLRGTTPCAGSGFGGDADQWRLRRGHIVRAIDREGTFLDVGCANGLLMESVVEWAEHRIEPYGVDIAPRLVKLARERLPHWADRIKVGNAIDYRPERRFTFVHALLDLVPVARRGDLVRHALDAMVEPGGRLLVSNYRSPGGSDVSATAHLGRLGFAVAGEAAAPDGSASTAWIESPER
jgi:2-polyprenyl-3-methyl-5-hydroxy-6-metoxy-1,4-benzoquinol methylase